MWIAGLFEIFQPFRDQLADFAHFIAQVHAEQGFGGHGQRQGTHFTGQVYWLSASYRILPAIQHEAWQLRAIISSSRSSRV